MGGRCVVCQCIIVGGTWRCNMLAKFQLGMGGFDVGYHKVQATLLGFQYGATIME